jgi:hypothetical protein
MQERDKASIGVAQMNMCGRQGTADMLRDEAKRLVAEAARLNELADQIGHLTTGADEALYGVMCRVRR